MELPNVVLCDTSVLVRFFHDHDDAVQVAADRLRHAWIEGRKAIVLLDLSVYELINVIVRRLGWPAARAERSAAQLFDLEVTIVGCDAELAASTARIAATTGLSGYDAAFVAAARLLDVALVTGDARILTTAPDGAIPLANVTA